MIFNLLVSEFGECVDNNSEDDVEANRRNNYKERQLGDCIQREIRESVPGRVGGTVEFLNGQKQDAHRMLSHRPPVVHLCGFITKPIIEKQPIDDGLQIA